MKNNQYNKKYKGKYPIDSYSSTSSDDSSNNPQLEKQNRLNKYILQNLER